jgi:hypothetical protein
MRAVVIFYYTPREPEYFPSYREAYDWACEYNRNHPTSTSIAVAFEEDE